jgi:hypothetical protein
MRKATKNRKVRQMSGRALTKRQKTELAALAALPPIVKSIRPISQSFRLTHGRMRFEADSTVR